MQAERRKDLPLTPTFAALAALALDQLSKALVRAYLPPGKTVSIWFLDLRQARNSGIAFGIFPEMPWFLFILGTAVLVALVLVLWRWGRPGGAWFCAGLGLIIGGALGNIIDRIALGEVVDFIDFGFWPIFNIADTAIVVGVGIIMFIVAARSFREAKEREEN